MQTFLQKIHEGRVSDEEIVQRMKDASSVVMDTGIPDDTSRASDDSFYVLAQNYFEERIAIRDVISVLKSTSARSTNRKSRSAKEETKKKSVPEEAYYTGREYQPRSSCSWSDVFRFYIFFTSRFFFSPL